MRDGGRIPARGLEVLSSRACRLALLTSFPYIIRITAISSLVACDTKTNAMSAQQHACTGFESNLQFPQNNVSGLVCMTSPFGGYPRFAQCCDSPVHNVTQPTTPGDLGYPASCTAWCYVKPERTVGHGSAQNPYGFDDYYLCLIDNGYETDSYGGTCGWVNDAAGEASSIKYLTATQWAGFTTWAGTWPSATTSVASTTDATPVETSQSISTSLVSIPVSMAANSSEIQSPAQGTETQVASGSTSTRTQSAMTSQTSMGYSNKVSSSIILTLGLSCAAFMANG